MHKIATFLLAGALALPSQAALAAPAPRAVKSLHVLFDSEWERGLAEYPEGASFLGDSRYNDRWTDLSPGAIERRNAASRAALARLLKIPRAALPAAEQVNYDLFRHQLETGIEYQRFHLEQLPVAPTSWSGFGAVTALAEAQPFATVRDYEDWCKRLETFGTLVDQNIALMREGIAAHRVPPRVPMQRIPAQVKAYAPDKPEDNPLYAPLRAMPATIGAADADRLRARAAAAIRDVVVPAWKRFGAFFETDYLPACRDSIAAEDMPDGAAFYALRVRDQTTTNLTPDAIHELGLSEVARIRAEMEKIMREVGFKGSLTDFFAYLRSDKKFFYKTGQELLDAYAVLTRRIDPELVKLFGTLPRTPYGVRAIPDSEAPNTTTAFYRQPAEKGRAGYYYVNLYKPETRPKWEMEALTSHEAVPGHHLQLALQQELGELPKFRRFGGCTAFVEGWALYSESLGYELGLYTDPYSKFGQLTYEMWRAVRLVVDTGIHHKGWSRQQAIDYFMANAAKTQNDVTVEVDRYIGDPGQALAYKIGQLKIRELRTRAEGKLGEKFDVRAFHDVVLGQGAVPLDVLEATVDRWIAAQTSLQKN